jgi:hypothetical protein
MILARGSIMCTMNISVPDGMKSFIDLRAVVGEERSGRGTVPRSLA